MPQCRKIHRTLNNSGIVEKTEAFPVNWLTESLGLLELKYIVNDALEIGSDLRRKTSPG